MAEVVERLVATLEADIRGFTKNMQEAQRQFDQRAAAIERRQNGMVGRLNTGFNKLNLNALIGRYASWGAVVAATQRIVSRSIEVNAEAAASYAQLDKSLDDLANNSGPLVTAFFNALNFVVQDANRELENFNRFLEKIKSATNGGVTVQMGVSPLQPGYDKFATLDSNKNWTPMPGGFPASGVTDVTPGQDKELEAALAYGEQLMAEARKLSADRIENEEETQRQLLEDALAYGEQLLEQSRELAARRIDDEERLQQQLLEDALAYGEQLAEETRELTADRIQAQLEAQAERIAQIGDAFEYLGQAAFEGGEAFSRALSRMAQSLALSGLRSLFEAGLNSLSGGGGFLGNLISGARAEGGPVSGGQAYLVGEKGPEIFRPGSSGIIIPNAVASRGGGSMVVNMPIDARGAQAGVAEQIARVAPAIVDAAFHKVRRNFKSMTVQVQRDQL